MIGFSIFITITSIRNDASDKINSHYKLYGIKTLSITCKIPFVAC